jgi:hypothetical protein
MVGAEKKSGSSPRNGNRAPVRVGSSVNPNQRWWIRRQTAAFQLAEQVFGSKRFCPFPNFAIEGALGSGACSPRGVFVFSLRNNVTALTKKQACPSFVLPEEGPAPSERTVFDAGAVLGWSFY